MTRNTFYDVTLLILYLLQLVPKLCHCCYSIKTKHIHAKSVAFIDTHVFSQSHHGFLLDIKKQKAMLLYYKNKSAVMCGNL